MRRRHFLQTALTAGLAVGAPPAAGTPGPGSGKARYRAGVIGLGWMGLLYDLADRIPDRFDVDDADRPTPELDIHRRFHHHDHPGNEGLPTRTGPTFWTARRPGCAGPGIGPEENPEATSSGVRE